MTSARMIWMGTLSALTSACTVRTEPFSYTVPASEVAGIAAEIERGDVLLHGGGVEAVSIVGESWGRASAEDKAAAREAGNSWHVTLPETRASPLHIGASSERGMAGVDFSIETPPTMASTLDVASGSVTLRDLRGAHTVHASGVVLEASGGVLDLRTGMGGVEGVLALEEGDDIWIATQGGDVDLEVPYGLDYDISIWSHPEAEVSVDVDGLWMEYDQPGHYAGQSLRGTVHITIMADEGNVTLRDTWSWVD